MSAYLVSSRVTRLYDGFYRSSDKTNSLPNSSLALKNQSDGQENRVRLTFPDRNYSTYH